jgi:hypothetical protein
LWVSVRLARQAETHLRRGKPFGKLPLLLLSGVEALPCQELPDLLIWLYSRGVLRRSAHWSDAVYDRVSDTTRMRHASFGNIKSVYTEVTKQVHTGTIATRQQRHLSASYHSRRHGVSLYIGQAGMTGTQEDIIDDFIHQIC